MTTMLIYDKIVPLNKERHRDLKLNIKDAKFAKGVHYVPMVATELYMAARDLAVVFAGNDKDNVGLVALLGIREGENLFVNEEGQWDRGTYMPAYLRRYPFIISQGQDAEKFTLCIDESYEGFSTEEGRELLKEDGEGSEYLDEMVKFLTGFSNDAERTRAFVERLKELDLLTKRELRVGDDKGRNYFLKDLYLVDEEKLAKLEDDQVVQLHRDGHMAWIYAHLVSVGNAGRLPFRLPADAAPAAEKAEETEAANQ